MKTNLLLSLFVFLCLSCESSKVKSYQLVLKSLTSWKVIINMAEQARKRDLQEIASLSFYVHTRK